MGDIWDMTTKPPGAGGGRAALLLSPESMDDGLEEMSWQAPNKKKPEVFSREKKNTKSLQEIKVWSYCHWWSVKEVICLLSWSCFFWKADFYRFQITTFQPPFGEYFIPTNSSKSKCGGTIFSVFYLLVRVLRSCFWHVSSWCCRCCCWRHPDFWLLPTFNSKTLNLRTPTILL